MENQITKQDFIKFFPDETKAIEQSFDAPKRVSLSMPCKGYVPECWILQVQDEKGHRTLVKEPDGRQYKLRKRIFYSELD